MRFAYYLLIALFVVGALAAPGAAQQTGWQLVWADEFNGTAGTKPDSTKWGYETGGGGWGNNEWENYTTSAANASYDGNGHLVIKAIKTGTSDGIGAYTSARLLTRNAFTVKYGKIEARLKMPFGQGIWPAFWMLGDDMSTVRWPGCGELDIMENVGKEPSTVHGTIHGPGYSGGNGIGGPYTLPNGQKFSDDFHTFAVVWEAQSIEWFVDGNSYFKVTPANLPAGTKWVFDHPFFIIMNLAVGGNWPGYPDKTTQFPQSLTVDYVRVYQQAAGPAANYNGVADAALLAQTVAPGAIATLTGVSLSDVTSAAMFDTQAGAYKTGDSGVQVKVNGVPAPLIFLSPGQLYFQVPWGTQPGPATVTVIKGATTVTVQPPVTVAATAPGAYHYNDPALGRVAILTCPEGAKANAECILWGNGFGQTNPPAQDGRPFDAAQTPANTPCGLKIGAVEAPVTYCGGTQSFVINQINFTYPPGVTSDNSRTVTATLTVGANSAQFQVPLLQ